jgi:hypothetical protein
MSAASCLTCACLRQAWVPEKYAAKIREEVVDSVEELVEKRCLELSSFRSLPR